MSHHRRLSSRRGSISASDPWGNHSELNLNPSRSSSSTLTIVRVASPAVNPCSPSPSPLQERPPSPVLAQRRQHKRIGSNPSSTGSNSDPSSTRLSFAFSSFSGSGPTSGGPASGSPHTSGTAPGSPRLRPASPGLSHRPRSYSKPRLTPEQLFDLARQSTNPLRYASDYPLARSRPHSPVMPFHPPTLLPSHPIMAPATFTPLPASVYLPFIDRPAEVSILISTMPTVKLFSLLAQTFPKPNSTYSPSLIASSPTKGTLPPDPTTWSFDHLCMWLTQVDRDTSPDAPWIREVRRCILGRSELIWERVKGALGVPPELDVEDFSLRVHEDVFDDDDGESSHWGDWDSMEQSPIQVERPGALEMDDSRVAQTQAYPIVVNEAVRPTENLDSCSPTQDDLGKSDEITTHAHVTPVCAVSQTCAYTYPYPYSHLSIEPLMADAPSAESASGMPSLSLSVSGTHATDPVVGEGLQDIAEGAEEEEPDDGEQDKPSVDTQGRGELESEEKGLNASLIHGLRISTAPSHGPPLVLSPRSPMPSYSRPQSDAGVGSRVSSRSTSFSSLGGASASSHLGIARDSPLAISGHLNNTAVLHHLGLKRSASLTSSIGRRGSFKRTESFSSLRAGSTWRGDVPYDPVAERGPGSPLFPSNFTKLTLEPTLSANNPNLRCQSNPPVSVYAAGEDRGEHAVQNAPTFGSESSAGGKD